ENYFAVWVVIPVFAELTTLPQTLQTLAAALASYSDSAAVLLVINHMPNSSPEAKHENLQLLAQLRNEDAAALGGLQAGKNLFWLDCASPECELSKGGVGMARKIGLDNVLKSIRRSDGLLFSLDADTLVPENYICGVVEEFRRNPAWAGAVLDFQHQLPEHPSARQAVINYEAYIKDYYQKLCFAKSPYAFWALGSAIVTPWEEYIRSGGMRIREAGEDFYFLQALRKIGIIGVIDSVVVHPSGRFSDRVPFGTGRKVEMVVQGSEIIENFPLAPFEELKKVFFCLDSANEISFFEHLPENLSNLADVNFRRFLDENNFAAAWTKIYSNTPRKLHQQRQAFHCWFDGLKTLQFVRSYFVK
ncbi:MAG: hypothetical protein RRY34_04180, partial [Victivallaceae bacterium]